VPNNELNLDEENKKLNLYEAKANEETSVVENKIILYSLRML
jgi:hypothetical protein